MKTAPLFPAQALMLVGFMLVAVSPCGAQQMNEQDSPCTAVVVTSDQVTCLSKARDTADSKLNSLYKALLTKLDASDANRLVQTERVWVKYRDANCSAERALYEGGTAATPVYLACLEGMTRARTKELRVTYNVRLK
jgi:uncharacterized protein YecT (DUF1311 family)